MDSLEALQQINILSSAILSNFNSITLKKYIEDYYIPFQKNAKKETIIFLNFPLVLSNFFW